MLGFFLSPLLIQMYTTDSVITCENFQCLFMPNMLSLWHPAAASSTLLDILTTLCLGSSATRSSLHLLETIYSLPPGAVIITINQADCMLSMEKAYCPVTRLVVFPFILKHSESINGRGFRWGSAIRHVSLQ